MNPVPSIPSLTWSKQSASVSISGGPDRVATEPPPPDWTPPPPVGFAPSESKKK